MRVGRRGAWVLVAAALVTGACSSPTRSATTPTTSGATAASRPATAGAAPTTTVDPHDPVARAEQAYLFGYPLVVTVRTFQLLASFAGTNRLFWQTSLSSPSLRIIVAPNHDTIYALAVLDLRAGPMALTVPAISDRYYTFQLIDAWMGTFAYVGTRATQARAGTWVVVPPGWSGPLPAGTQRLDAPTNQVVLLGRFAARGDADVANVLVRRGQVTVRPLTALTGRPAAPAPPPIGRPRGRPQAVGAGNDPAYFDELGDALVANPPPSPAGRRLLAGLASLGIGPGRHPSTEVTDPATRQALADGIAAGNRALADPSQGPGQLHQGWRVVLDAASLGDDGDPRQRARVARYGWGPNLPAEAVYPTAQASSDGRALTGASRYVIHFAPGQLPPVDAFWSITLYGPDRFMVENPIHRYELGSQSPGLQRGPDGSLDLYVQATPPAGHEANWLPTPAGAFSLVMRLYLPRPPVLDGTYRYPAITRR